LVHGPAQFIEKRIGGCDCPDASAGPAEAIDIDLVLLQLAIIGFGLAHVVNVCG
jgi:hypothetical protein